MEGWPHTFWVNQGGYSMYELKNLCCAWAVVKCDRIVQRCYLKGLPSSWNVKLLLAQPGWTWGTAETASDGAKMTLQPQNTCPGLTSMSVWGGMDGWMEDYFSWRFQSLSPKICVELYTSLLKQFKLCCAQILRSCSLWAEVWGLKAFGCISKDI